MFRRIINIIYIFTTLLFPASSAFAQQMPRAEITFDFNDHTFNEKEGRLKMKAVGVSFATDRFGNKESAAHLTGNINSYLNLGTSPLLKPRKGTISLWINLYRMVRTGRGSPYNPIIVTKNSENPGWYNAYTIGYELSNGHLTSVASLDSVKNEASVASNDSILLNRWYHLVLAFNDDSLYFYLDGELQNKSYKGFATKYLASDSVVVGHAASKVNVRFAQGIFDDIQFFHRVLSPSEIKSLYNAPNPNEFKRKLYEVIKYGSIVLACGIVILLILYRNKQKLKRQREQLELNARVAELEMKVVKTQMNPHFISNCLSAIQELIYAGSIENAGQYIAKFSLFMRQVLNYSNNTYTTLKEELEIIKLNIELEQLRFRENLHFEVQTSPEINLDETMVPSLITQPLIENAIWHGLLPLGNLRKPSLIIHISSKNNSVFITIEDNGVGRIKNSSGDNGRISHGTKLVKEKLESVSKLTNSNNYKMEIIDVLDEAGKPFGTKVIIELDNTKDNI